MSVKKGSKKKSLAEQILALSTPQPVPTYHPDQEFLGDDTAAKICDYHYEEQQARSPSPADVSGTRTKRKGGVGVGLGLEEDPRYAGRVVSRRELETDSAKEGSASDVNSDLSGDEDSFGYNLSDDEGSATADDEDEDDATSIKFNAISDQPEREEAGLEEEEEEAGGMAVFSQALLTENVEKGKAARKQIKLLDGLLETRIKFQGVLSLANRLPSADMMPLFLEEGGDPLREKMDETQRHLCQLLDGLLELQSTLSSRMSQQKGGVAREGVVSPGDAASSDEEVPSDEEEKGERRGEATPPLLGPQRAAAFKRKRPRSWESSGGRDYAEEIAREYETLRPYRNDIISKWNEKTKLATGKITSKSFMEVDRSILSQIEHVMKDKERLRRRTQLKRSVYRVLGRPDDEVETAKGTDQSDPERDAHLKDYDENIFDDDDFYHQLLRELIERKTSYSESSDPIEMGRQWLELQKLRTKSKKKADTKASKGRKIRYSVHPKLVNFMAPFESGTFSDTARNSLFCSLFGALHHHRTTN